MAFETEKKVWERMQDESSLGPAPSPTTCAGHSSLGLSLLFPFIAILLLIRWIRMALTSGNKKKSYLAQTYISPVFLASPPF